MNGMLQPVTQSFSKDPPILKRPKLGNNKEKPIQKNKQNASNHTELNTIKRIVTENESIPLVKETSVTVNKNKIANLLADDYTTGSPKSSWNKLNEQDSSDEDIPLSKMVKMKKNKTDTSTSKYFKGTDKSGDSGAGSMIFGNKRPLSMLEKLQVNCSQREKTSDLPPKLLSSNFKQPNQPNSSDNSPSEEDLPAIFSSPIKFKQKIAERTKEILLASSENNKQGLSQNVSIFDDDYRVIVRDVQPPPIPINNTDGEENIHKSSAKQVEDTQCESEVTPAEIPSKLTSNDVQSQETKNRKGKKKRQPSSKIRKQTDSSITKNTKKKPKKNNKSTETKASHQPVNKKDLAVNRLSIDKSLIVSPIKDPAKPTQTTHNSSLDDTNELLDRLEQADSATETTFAPNLSPSPSSVFNSSGNMLSLIKKVRSVSVKVKNIQTRSKSMLRTNKKPTKNQVCGYQFYTISV